MGKYDILEMGWPVQCCGTVRCDAPRLVDLRLGGVHFCQPTRAFAESLASLGPRPSRWFGTISEPRGTGSALRAVGLMTVLLHIAVPGKLCRPIVLAGEPQDAMRFSAEGDLVFSNKPVSLAKE